jgi:hypothetical protein
MSKRKKFASGIEEEIELCKLKMQDKERCMNPWNGKCNNTEIALYIMFKGKRLPICRECWEEISSKNIEWEYD